jgi:hypothetical protein
MVGGKRRIDRVLSPDFTADAETASLDEIRRRRFEAEQEEADLSYLRRLLHGRIDIVEAELARRHSGGERHSLVEDLAAILSDPSRAARGLGRHLSVEPTRVAEHRRLIERVVADPALSDVGSRPTEELEAVRDRLRGHEVEVSEVRHQVQHVVDVLSSELTRRYRDGRANVDSLLRGE